MPQADRQTKGWTDEEWDRRILERSPALYQKPDAFYAALPQLELGMTSAQVIKLFGPYDGGASISAPPLYCIYYGYLDDGRPRFVEINFLGPNDTVNRISDSVKDACYVL